MSGPFGSSQWMYASGGFYNGVATQSLRFDDGSTAYLDRDFTGSSPDDDKKMVISVWVKRANLSGSTQVILANYNAVRFLGELSWDSSNKIAFRPGGNGNGASNSYKVETSSVFRDVSSWYHIVLAYDSTQTTDTNRVKLYVNGTEQTLSAVSGMTFPPLNYAHLFSYAGPNNAIGYYPGGFNSNYLDGYLSEFNFIDGLSIFSDTSGTLSTTFNVNSFGELKNGVWIPIEYTGSYGTNGYRLQFNQTGTGTASSSTIGADTSGNANHFSSSGIVASDCDMPDSPENNFATLNPLSFLTDNQLENGNLELDHQTTTHRANTGTMFMQTGKWYFEVYNTNSASSGLVAIGVGLQDISKLLSYASGDDNYLFYSNNNNAKFYTDTSVITLGTGGTHVPTAGSIIQVAYDADTGNIFIGVNNTYIAEDGGSDGNPATGANPTKTLSTNIDYIPFVGVYNNIAIANFGQDSTFAGATTAGGNADGNGNGDFAYAVPSGYLALCTANLPEPTISPNADTQADDYFNTVLYTGNGGTLNVTGVGFAPDWVWIKDRGIYDGYNYEHALYDTSRGVNNHLRSSTTGQEGTQAGSLTAFGSDGFTLGSHVGQNTNNESYVAWNWKANGGTTSSNTDGSITSTVQANTDAGFSIVTYTGTGSSATVGHGLGVAPNVIIVKNRIDASDWFVYHSANTSAPETDVLQLNLTDATVDFNPAWNDTLPTSSVFTVGTSNASNGSSDTMVAFVFAEIESYSKFGSYTGNGSAGADAPFIYLGFRPAWVMIKRTNAVSAWDIFDSTRNTFNVVNNNIQANANTAEASYTDLLLDFLSNGIKIRQLGVNASGGTYIYMAFAENPFKYANAR